MNQEKTNRNCESCRTEIKVLDLCQEPNLILCELCKPWVLSSIYQVPRQVIGIDIEDPSLFRTSLRLTENLQSPSTESAWYKFLKFIFSKQSDSSDEESEMLTKIRLDYAGRNAIYSQEAHDLFILTPLIIAIGLEECMNLGFIIISLWPMTNASGNS